MHVLYVHQNFPAQFGHIASHLVSRHGYRCSFVSAAPAGDAGGVRRIQYKVLGGATKHNHFCSRTFENSVWHSDAVYQALKGEPAPDLIVGHSGFGSTLLLRDLYPRTPVINLFEYYYRPHTPENDMDFRTDLGWDMPIEKYHRARCRNAMILLDLQNCQAGYAPTAYQRSTFPDEYTPKLRTIFDGIDRNVYHGFNGELRASSDHRPPRTLAGVNLPAGAKVVTYVSRGFESMRGFDVFLKAADRVCREMPDAHVIVVGSDRIAYGGDESYLDGKTSFKDWTIARGNIDGQPFDLSRIHFVGTMPTTDLARLLAASDAHVYLTVPFVLSWSMMNAMSCGAVVIASSTAPVREMITHGQNGLLCDFFDPRAFAETILQVLADPAAHRPLGDAAERLIEEKYSLAVVLPQMLKIYEDVMDQPSTGAISDR